MPVIWSPSSTVLLALRADSAKASPVVVAAALLDIVAWVESVTARMTVPAGITDPPSVSTTGLPTSPGLNAAVALVMVAVPPVVAPSVKDAKPPRRLGSWKARFEPLGTAVRSVTDVPPLPTDRITSLAGMVGPVIGWATSLSGNLALLDVNVVVPVLLPSPKLAGGVIRLGREKVMQVVCGPAGQVTVPIAAFERVTWVALMNAWIVVPAGMWVPPSVSTIGWPTSASVKVAVADVKVLEPPVVAPSW